MAIAVSGETDGADDLATEDSDRLAGNVVIPVLGSAYLTPPEMREHVDALHAHSARLEEVVKVLLGAVHTLDQAMSRCSIDYCDSPVSGGLLVALQHLSEEVFGMSISALAAQTAAAGLGAYTVPADHPLEPS